MAVNFDFWINSPIFMFGFGRTERYCSNNKEQSQRTIFYCDNVLLRALVGQLHCLHLLGSMQSDYHSIPIIQTSQGNKTWCAKLGTSKNQELNYSVCLREGSNLEFDLPGGLENQVFE